MITNDALTITVPHARKISGLGYTKLWELIGLGTLKTVSVGRRRLVVYQSLVDLLTPKSSSKHRNSARPRKPSVSKASEAA